MVPRKSRGSVSRGLHPDRTSSHPSGRPRKTVVRDWDLANGSVPDGVATDCPGVGLTCAIASPADEDRPASGRVPSSESGLLNASLINWARVPLRRSFGGERCPTCGTVTAGWFGMPGLGSEALRSPKATHKAPIARNREISKNFDIETIRPPVNPNPESTEGMGWSWLDVA